MHRVGHISDAVFGDDDDAPAFLVRGLDQLAAAGVDFAEILFQARVVEVGPDALQIVVEMREVGEGKRRLSGCHHMQCRFGNPIA